MLQQQEEESGMKKIIACCRRGSTRAEAARIRKLLGSTKNRPFHAFMTITVSQVIVKGIIIDPVSFLPLPSTISLHVDQLQFTQHHHSFWGVTGQINLAIE